MPANAAVGVQVKVLVYGLAPEVPLAGLMTEPAGALVALSRSVPAPGTAPVVDVVKTWPMLAMNVPEPTQVGGGGVTVSMIRSSAVELSSPPWVDSEDDVNDILLARRPLGEVPRDEAASRRVGERGRLVPDGLDRDVLRRRGMAPSVAVLLDHISELVAKRHVTASPSGSKAGKVYVRTAPTCIWMRAGAAETGPAVLPGARPTLVSTRKLAPAPLTRPATRALLWKKAV